MLAQPRVRAGELDTELLDRLVVDYAAPTPTPAALVAGALGTLDLGDADDVWTSAVAFRIGVPSPIVTRLVCDGRTYRVSALVTDSDTRTLHAEVTITGDDDAEVWQGTVYPSARRARGHRARNGIGARWVVAQTSSTARWVSGEDGTWVMQLAHTLADSDDAEAAGDVRSPMPGTVVAVPGVDGAAGRGR